MIEYSFIIRGNDYVPENFRKQRLVINPEIMARPLISTRGLPGNLVEANRAGIIPRMLIKRC